VAALNPHGGEQGLLGREELDEIEPAVAAARTAGIDAVGPLPADSVFNRAIDGEFDVVLAMYHDQGHIAIKVHNFHESTTATLGIPFVRTSVDHGTAFDIAGSGRADERGLAAALDAARALSQGQLARL
jgi:4-hydroxythreonine-4-phosphate dehydrogenase